MPKTISKQGLTRQVRQGVRKGPEQKRLGRTAGVGTTPQAPAIIADSIFALKLKEKPAVMVAMEFKERIGYKRFEEIDYHIIYRDLLAVVHHVSTLVGKPTKFDPLASGLDLSASLFFVTSFFKNNIVPKDWRFEIRFSGEKSQYVFLLTRECDCPAYWQTISVKPVLEHYEGNKAIIDVFVEVIARLSFQSDIPTWWNDALGYTDYMIEENIEFWDDGRFDEDEAEEQRDLWIRERDKYEDGEPAAFKQKVKEAANVTIDELEAKIKALVQNELTSWMLSVCEFLRLPGCVLDFVLMDEDDYTEGLNYDQQVAILWDDDDLLSTFQGEAIDAEANGVVVNLPTLNLEISQHTKSIDLSEMNERSKWPRKLEKLISQYFLITNNWKNAKSDRNTGGLL